MPIFETREQLHDLAKMGCRLFQGYYFSRPVPVEEFEAMGCRLYRA